MNPSEEAHLFGDLTGDVSLLEQISFSVQLPRSREEIIINRNGNNHYLDLFLDRLAVHITPPYAEVPERRAVL